MNLSLSVTWPMYASQWVGEERRSCCTRRRKISDDICDSHREKSGAALPALPAFSSTIDEAVPCFFDISSGSTLPEREHVRLRSCYESSSVVRCCLQAVEFEACRDVGRCLVRCLMVAMSLQPLLCLQCRPQLADSIRAGVTAPRDRAGPL